MERTILTGILRIIDDQVKGIRTMSATWEEPAGPESCLPGHRKSPPPLRTQDLLRNIVLEELLLDRGFAHFIHVSKPSPQKNKARNPGN